MKKIGLLFLAVAVCCLVLTACGLKDMEPDKAEYDLNQIEKSIKATRRKMEEAAKRLDFVEAAHLRDEMLRMEERAKEMRE